jgi:hypothetical protein
MKSIVMLVPGQRVDTVDCQNESVEIVACETLESAVDTAQYYL